MKRQRDLNGARRFLLLECTELGEFTQSHGGNNGDFLLHVDFQQPAEMRFNRARVRRAFVTIGQRHMRDARRLVMRRARSAPGENPGYQTDAWLVRLVTWYPEPVNIVLVLWHV